MITIATLDATAARRHGPALAAVLADCVAGGASVSFMSPYGQAEAEAFFRSVADKVEAGTLVLLAAFDGDDLVGTVQLDLGTPPNQPHRADVKKLLVHRRARGRGIATRLMAALEEAARARGRWLLVLDTASGSDADRLYPKLGYQRFGLCPDYALWPQGGLCDTTYYLKRLDEIRLPPRPGILVRDASEDDLPAIVAILNEAIATTTAVWTDKPVDLDDRRRWWRERVEAGNPVLVAEVGGRVAGFGSYLQFRAWDGYRNAVEHSVYVEAGRRGEGVGAALVEALMARAKAGGKQVIIGGIEGGNRASLRLHRRAGFIEVGRMPEVGEKFGRKLDLVFMQKRL